MIALALIVCAAVFACLNLSGRTAAHWQVPVAILCLCLALVLGVDPVEIELR